jgi:hypothetical protein
VGERIFERDGSSAARSAKDIACGIDPTASSADLEKIADAGTSRRQAERPPLRRWTT